MSRISFNRVNPLHPEGLLFFQYVLGDKCSAALGFFVQGVPFEIYAVLKHYGLRLGHHVT